uniref:ribonuclease III n=1 Tax=Haemaphysalis longicornis TaxID=44386 RepID=A0A8K1VZ45_HAELO|nr:dicer-1-like protein [Haemaphysalis longicornis]
MVVKRPGTGDAPPPRPRRHHFLENVQTKTFTPLEYQVELLDAAKQQNSIVFLSSGKTFMVVMLVKELAYQVRPNYDSGGKRVLILVPSAESGVRHQKMMEDYTDLKSVFVDSPPSGSPSNSHHVDFPKLFREHHVLVLTAAAFNRHLVEADADVAEELMDRVNLAVFDECHRALRCVEFESVLGFLLDFVTEGRLSVLALAAPLATRKRQRPSLLEAEILELEEGFQSAACTSSELTVLSKYGSRPREVVVEFAAYGESSGGSLETALRLLDEAMDFLAGTEKHLDEQCRAVQRQSQRYLVELCYTLVTLGPWCAHEVADLFLRELSQTLDSLVLPQTWARMALLIVHTVIQQVAQITERPAADLEPSDDARQPAKFRHLLRILREYRPPPPPPQPLERPQAPEGSEASSVRPAGVESGTQHQGATDGHTAPSVDPVQPATLAVLASSALTVPVSCKAENANGSPTSEPVSVLADGIDKLSVSSPERTGPIPSGDADTTNAATVPTPDTGCAVRPSGDGPQTPGRTAPTSAVGCRPVGYRGDFADDPNALCGIVFVRQRITAYILSMWLSKVAARFPEEYGFITPNFLVGRTAPLAADGRDARSVPPNALTPLGLQRQEEVLQKFRSRECNLLVATSVVEEGIEVPRCNLVVRFDPPENFRAYVQSKGKAKAAGSRYFVLVPHEESARFLGDLHDYRTTEQILLERSHVEDTTLEEDLDPAYADSLRPAYKPLEAEDAAKVTMSTAIALVNRYCAKLPSDTFTRLTPISSMAEVETEDGSAEGEGGSLLYRCSLRLPINSPLRRCIVGDAMPTKLLAKQAAALKACEELHKMGELDDQLVPQGKEAMRLALDQSAAGRLPPEEDVQPGGPRPGTTKRRQRYDKKVSEVLRGQRVGDNDECHLYAFSLKLTCPIPEEQNTRGRKIHDPADTARGFGLVTSRRIPLICSFPVFTRSGEVTVELEHVSSELGPLSAKQARDLTTFHRYTFTNVLRLEKYPMTFNPEGDACSFLVVPINAEKPTEDKPGGSASIDWHFVERICQEESFTPRRIPEEERELFIFKEDDYLDTVVTPWYRNLDKPQYFYVAEICHELNPLSDFPDAGFETFDAYYQEKYGIRVVDGRQPLLDVDHTSARLNLLTPRYVNRKGVTLPTSSEQTKRAKRESLQQKQILVPELCAIHPFPASLWRKADCLPCILYRMNSLLLAEQLRLQVAREVRVGLPELPEGFKWPTLGFGWTLADVLQKAHEAAKAEEERVAQLMERTGIQPVRISSSPPPTARAAAPAAAGGWRSTPYLPPPYQQQELVIDTFDPSKVEIPDDDQLADAEVSALNLGGPKGPNFDWKPLPKLPGEPTPVPRIRYGSPSNFEAEGWDSEWDTDMEDSSFVTLDMPGLGYISAPGVFNMQGLSLDLASCRDDDIWDRFDEDEDEAELEFARSEWNQSPSEAGHGDHEEEGLRIGDKPEDKDEKRPEEQLDWLSHCSKDQRGKSAEVSVEDSEEELVEVDPFIEEKVAALREECAKKLEVWRCDDKEAKLAEQKKVYESFRRVSEALKLIAEYEDDRPLRKDEVASVVRDGVPTGAAPPTPEGGRVLPFGELLPDRDSVETNGAGSPQVRFDERPNLNSHSGPSPSILLQALTMSNANDGINLERLETVGDSFLKYAVTAHLYCTYPSVHEGKLSHLRSRQISNLNLYRLGRACNLGGLMVATKFEPSDNWLPPGYVVPPGLERALIESGLPAGHWNIAALTGLTQMDEAQIRQTLAERRNKVRNLGEVLADEESLDTVPYVPYNLLTQHSTPDKSIADCVEALIGAYLVSCGPHATLLFMSWLGLDVLPKNCTAETLPDFGVLLYGTLEPPLVVPDAGPFLDELLSGYDAFEARINYRFRDRAYLLQAFTHASYHYNRLTDCYQRLEFLGDAVLDYLITRHLHDDPQRHSPGTLTDLRSALVNNTFFASLAVKYDFHRYFKNVSPGLFAVIQRFVEMKRQNNGLGYHEEYYLEEEECEEAEEVEVPKALGDIFESVAGAIFLDSNMSLDTVWRVYYAMMKPEIEYFSTHVPKSPIRELLELEPQTAKFERAEMTLNGKVRIRVEVFGKGRFVGVGRNKRIAKCTAAKRALRALKRMRQEGSVLPSAF